VNLTTLKRYRRKEKRWVLQKKGVERENRELQEAIDKKAYKSLFDRSYRCRQERGRLGQIGSASCEGEKEGDIRGSAPYSEREVNLSQNRKGGGGGRAQMVPKKAGCPATGQRTRSGYFNEKKIKESRRDLTTTIGGKKGSERRKKPVVPWGGGINLNNEEGGIKREEPQGGEMPSYYMTHMHRNGTVKKRKRGELWALEEGGRRMKKKIFF